MESSTAIRLFEEIIPWTNGDQRAPHKPLLVLYAFGCWLRGEFSIPYSVARKPLARLLTEFGPPRKVCHPEQPFWRLQRNRVWEVTSTGTLIAGKDGAPSSSELIRKCAIGRFPKRLQAAFRKDPTLIPQITRQLLAAHFPLSLHNDICTAVGLSEENKTGSVGPGRDPNFRKLVLKTYEQRCAVCGLQLLLSGIAIAIEAAHIKWHQAAGPATTQNGIALCVLHHKVFDLGAFTIGAKYEILVSDEVTGLSGLTEHLLNFHGKPLLPPIHAESAPAIEYIEWHRREVFRGRPRPATTSV